MESLGNAPTGYQLRADGAGITCHIGALRQFLYRAVEVTGLTLIPPTRDCPNPMVSEAHGQGMALIAESHIWVGVHGPTATVVVFSCRPFSWARILRVAEETFGGTWRVLYGLERPPLSGGSRFRRTLRRFASW